MRLSEFIRKNHDEIVGEWVEFARTMKPWADGMSVGDLRDHAEELLGAVASDMAEPQSGREQSEKSQGLGEGGAIARVGQKHASLRLASGLNLAQLVSEFRALRATVLRLWADSQSDKEKEVTRFNEAIDEGLTESTIRYSEMLEHTREQFLAILGHDLRNPLSAIVIGATVLTQSKGVSDKDARVAARILGSARLMDRMVRDLLDFARTRLGSGIPVTPVRTDLGLVCEQVAAELDAAHPGVGVHFESIGNLVGEWDSDRLTQVISNLVANAVQYGGDDGAVRLVAEGQDDTVTVQVHNQGPAIPQQALSKIFDPMVRQIGKSRDGNAGGLGLGLHIAQAVVTAHGGTIGVTSTEKGGTTFTVQLPRRAGEPEVAKPDP